MVRMLLAFAGCVLCPVGLASAQELEHAQTRTGEPSVQSDPAEALRSRLDGIESSAGAVNRPAEYLRLAEESADARQWNLAIEAMSRGFRDGMTAIREVETTMDVRPYSNSAGGARARVIGIFDRARLFSRGPQHDLLSESEQAELATRRFDVLSVLVFPEDRSAEPFPCAENVLARKLRQSVDGAGVDVGVKIAPSSLARSLAQAAVDGERVDELETMIETRSEPPLAAVVGELVRLHLAVQQRNKEAARRSLAVMLAASPPADPTSSDPETFLNLLLHGCFTYEHHFGRSPEVVDVHRHLLAKTTEIPRLGDAVDALSYATEMFIKDSDRTDDEVRQWIAQYLEAVPRRFGVDSRGYDHQLRSRDAQDVVKFLIEAGRWTLARELSHEAALTWSDHLYRDNPFAHVALHTSKLPAADQYEFLSELVFGNSETDVQPVHAIATYADPPADLRPVATNLAAAKGLDVCTERFSCVSTSLMIAEAAAKCGRTAELVDRLKSRVKSPGDEADTTIGLALLADGQVDAAYEVLKRVDAMLSEMIPAVATDFPLPTTQTIFAARMLDHEQSRDVAESAWLSISIINAVCLRYSTKHPALRMLYGLGLGVHVGDDVDAIPKHLVFVQAPSRGYPVSEMTTKMSSVHDGTLKCYGGAEKNLVLIKYPVTGNFEFRHRRYLDSYGAYSSFYDGLAFYFYRTGSLGLYNRIGQLQNATRRLRPNRSEVDPLETLTMSDDTIHFASHELEVGETRSFGSMPFVGFACDDFIAPHGKDIEVAGSPTIPRQVDLIHPTLRGWNCSIIPGSLPDPIFPKSNRDWNPQPQKTAMPDLSWFVEDGAILTGGRIGRNDAGGQNHIHYLRPLLERETFSYEFYYQPDIDEIHPTIGRIAILLRDDGVRLRWLAQPLSLESYQIEPLHEVEPSTLVGDGVPNLKPNAWNTVRLTRDGDQVVVETNGKQLCRVELALDQRFGLLTERDRTARVRNATLSGQWPDKLPEDLLELE